MLESSVAWSLLQTASSIAVAGDGLILKHASDVIRCIYKIRDAYTEGGCQRHLSADLHADDATVVSLLAGPWIAAVASGSGTRIVPSATRITRKLIKYSLLALR